MNYIVAEYKKDSETVVLNNIRVVITKYNDPEEAKEMYRSLTGVDVSVPLLCKPVNKGAIDLILEVEDFRVCYPPEIKSITVQCLATDEIYVGYEIGRIPAMVLPSQDDILEFYYRGNLKRYKEALEKCETDPEARMAMRRINQALPWERVVIDTGTKNLIIPLNDDYVIQDC